MVSGVFYSVGPTLFYFLRSEVMGDRFSTDFLDPRRFTILVRWGEGPHLLSLVFLPLVGVFFALALRRKNFWLLVAAAVAFALTALSNALGMMGALLLVFSIAFVRYARWPKEHTRTAFSTVLLVLLGLGLVSFWFNLSFLTNFFGEGGKAASIYLSLFPWGWVGAIFGAGLLYLVVGKILRDSGVAASLVWFSLVFTVVYVYYFSADIAELRIELLPQALRYMTQVDLSFSVLVGAVVAWMLKRIGSRFRLAELILSLFLIVISMYSFMYIQPFLSVSAAATSNVVDLSRTRERVIAEWLSSHVDTEKGERVFLPGNYGFFLNWFTDVWQHRGALFQAATHPWPEHIHFQMANGKDPEVVRAWLVAINAKYAVVTGPGSSELYKEIKYLDRFADMPVVYEESGDTIYKVPLIRPSLAKPVDKLSLGRLVPPQKADDKQALLDYADWVEKSSLNEAEFRMIDHDTYTISGALDDGEAVLVQMTADPGWTAFDAARGKKVSKGEDPLGFLVLFPEPGEFEITLRHRSTWRQWLGYVTTAATLVFIVWYGVRRKRLTSSVER